MPMTYDTFLASKAKLAPSVGIRVDDADLHPDAFPFQRDITRWALQKGRSAIFATTGMGKTLMQLMWADKAAERVLILAPLGVARQTAREGARWGIPATYARSMADSPEHGITITNYEMVDHFDPSAFGAVVLDESGILKSFTGKTRSKLIELFADTPLKLCCTATPAPNDIAEIANHAEFLGIMTRVEMLASFFVHDDDGWRLKRPARKPFFRWLASWAMSINRPSDIGYSDDGYILPPLAVHTHFVESDFVPSGQLFSLGLKGITERASVRKGTVDQRVIVAADLIGTAETWIAWCGRNDEGDKLSALVDGAVLVEGAQSQDMKALRLAEFADGESRVLVTKPSIAGFGMNLQVCSRMVFVGLSDSWEQYFQAIRRCWRFGQTNPVEVHIVLSELERPIYENVMRKEAEAAKMAEELIAHVAEFERAEIGAGRARDTYEPRITMTIPPWLEVAPCM